ncbi:protease inhibitor I42 family protein [Enterobacter ludwigii]|uniref:protease inhibitor I42 family protein n=1 Tax=Enterobacter ludwigii TaxID=299767 RepID=UPI003F6EEAB6
MNNIPAINTLFLLTLCCTRIASVSAEPAKPLLSLSKCPSGYFTVITGNYGKVPEQQCLSEAPESISVPVDATFSITLPANPTTGAIWGLRHMPDSVMLMSAGYSPTPTNKTRIAGSGGEFSYTFRVTGQTSGTIKLDYGRQWERDAWSTRIINLKTT